MTAELQAAQNSLYTVDYVRWVETTLAALQAQDYPNVDWEHLLEEIADMSRRERQSLESNLIVILLHLLKWHYQPDGRTGSWKGSIREYRRRVNQALHDSPSLKPYFQDVLAACYEEARQQAADETGLPLTVFPAEWLYTPAAVLNAEVLPE